MSLSRRAFMSGISTASLAIAGLGEEVLVGAAEELGFAVPVARILFNENPLGPSPKALEVLSTQSHQFARYPLGESLKLSMLLRKMNGLPYVTPGPGLSLSSPEPTDGQNDFVLGVGSSEILRAAAWAYCSQGGSVVEAHPGYSAIGSAAARIPGAEVERKMVPLTSKLQLDTRAMIDAIDSDTRIVVVCNPNNPTGTTIPVSEVEAIVEAAPSDALVFIDEAYIEFVEGSETASCLEIAKSRENVLVARTFSKIYGLAGLRVGYAIGSKMVTEKIKPYLMGGLAHNMPGILAAIASLDDTEHLAATQKLKQSTYETWGRAFAGTGWKMTPTQTSFCWVDLGHDCTPLVEHLAARKVLISGGQRWDLPNCVRISMGTEDENERLAAGVRSFLAS